MNGLISRYLLIETRAATLYLLGGYKDSKVKISKESRDSLIDWSNSPVVAPDGCQSLQGNMERILKLERIFNRIIKF